MAATRTAQSAGKPAPKGKGKDKSPAPKLAAKPRKGMGRK